MLQKSVVMMAACLEIVVGAIVLLFPDSVCWLLFAARPDGLGMPLACFVGIALIALGIACLPSSSSESGSRAAEGLFAYNVGVVVLFAWVGVTTTYRGLALWPAVIVHALIAGALLPRLLTNDSPACKQLIEASRRTTNP